MAVTAEKVRQLNATVSCHDCKHFNRSTWHYCDAYPEGIPAPILAGALDHLSPREGDHGIQFDPIDEEAARMMRDMLSRRRMN